MQPVQAQLGPVFLSGNQPISWRIQTGVQPYQTVLQCHESDWGQIESRLGTDMELVIKQAGKTLRIKQVYPLYQIASDSPERVNFLVSDLRWRWPYKLHLRDYNIRRRTGDKFAVGSLPQTQVTSDTYKFLRYSINPGTDDRWQPEEVLEDVLDTLVDGEDYDYEVRETSFQSDPNTGGGAGNPQDSGIENLQIRDNGELALGRALAMLPGTDVYISEEGKIIVFNATDYEASEQAADKLPQGQIDANFLLKSNKRGLRPKRVLVYYAREMEVLWEYSEAWVGTSSPPNDSDPFLENVCVTVDPTTRITDKNPDTGESETNDNVPPGCYVPLRSWLEAMDEDRPSNSQPWTYETFGHHWIPGQLEPSWGAGGDEELDAEANVVGRVQNFIQHFRQTWRINPAYASRIRRLIPNRIGVFNFITGQRNPATVWSQMFIKPTNKAKTHFGADPTYSSIGRNVDYVPSDINQILRKPAGPWRMHMLDEQMGIFRTEWQSSPYGLDAQAYPGFATEFGSYQPTTLSRNMELADSQYARILMNADVQSAAKGFVLSPRFEHYVLATVVPAVPNGKAQYHRIDINSKDVALNSEVGDCRGPDMHVFVNPGELTARFGITSPNKAKKSLKQLLGLEDTDPDEALQPGEVPEGYALINTQQHLEEHAKAMAAQVIAPLLDAYSGTHAAPLEVMDDFELKGNIASKSIVISSAPSSKVAVGTQFSGVSRPIDRSALLPYSVRHIILRTMEF